MQQINPKKLTEILETLTPRHYWHRRILYQEYVKRNGSHLSEDSFNRYLCLWSRNDLIYSAGRNWYSDLPKEFELSSGPVSELTGLLQAKFPLLHTEVWSTSQISGYYHHLPGRFYNLIYIDRYAMPEAAELLQRTFPDSKVLLNPGRKELKTYTAQITNHIVRPLLESDQTAAEETVFPVEKLLADLALEAEKLSLMDETEFGILLDNIASSGRIRPGVIFRRLQRRKIKNGYCRILYKYFGANDYQLTSPFKKR